MGLVGPLQTFEVQDLSEVRVRFVGNVDEVGLDQRLRRRRSYLKRLEDRINP